MHVDDITQSERWRQKMVHVHLKEVSPRLMVVVWLPYLGRVDGAVEDVDGCLCREDLLDRLVEIGQRIERRNRLHVAPVRQLNRKHRLRHGVLRGRGYGRSRIDSEILQIPYPRYKRYGRWPPGSGSLEYDRITVPSRSRRWVGRSIDCDDGFGNGIASACERPLQRERRERPTRTRERGENVGTRWEEQCSFCGIKFM